MPTKKSDAKAIQEMIRQQVKDQSFIGTVTGTSGSHVLLKRAGYDDADTQAYAKIDGYTPVNGDRVKVDKVGTGWVVVGKIV